ncbi:type II secretion system protein N [Thiofilum flexile]|uniref:type II secretion system protein N n=1 Tax=Thiofilum flexile TaxID=125627 RepID=UPI00035F599C|nr:type II secretion system protein N [Thiofilum flexile]
MQSLNQRTWVGRLLDRMPDYLTLTLIVVCGSLLARLTWLMFPADADLIAYNQAQQELADTPNLQVIPAKAPQVNEGDEIARQNLFGQVQVATLKTPEPMAVAAPIPAKPREPVELTGVYALPGKEGLAILRIRGQQKVFKIDEPLVIKINNQNVDIGAVLHSVSDKAAVLDWGDNKKQTLSLETKDQPSNGAVIMPASDPMPEPDPAFSNEAPMFNDPMPQSLPDPIDMPQPEAPKQGDIIPPSPEDLPPEQQPLSLGQFREQALADNSRLFDLVTASPAKVNGQMQGFRVNPGKNMQLFQTTGLIAGDIVTEINGIPLNNMSSGIKALNTITKASNVSLKVLRAGTVITVDRQL